jgi:hypothetical protein
MKGKLAPRYIILFPILEKCVTVAYKLDLPPALAGVHDIFHVSQLRRCLMAPIDIVLPEVTKLEAGFSYPEHPIKVLDQKDHVTRYRTIKFFKIQWSNHTEEEATWESEDFLHSCHLDFMLPQRGNVRLFDVLIRTFSPSKSWVKIPVRGRSDTPSVTVAATMLKHYLNMYLQIWTEI